MQDFDDADLALVHALQIAPRASWALLGAVLGADPVTVARRWQRLSAAGDAWITGYGSAALMRRTSMALVAVSCLPGRLPEITERILDDPHAVTVEHTTGSCDLLVTVWTTGLAELSDYLVGRLSRLPGVTATRTTMVTDVYAEGSSWRVGVLDAAARDRLRRAALTRASGTGELRPVDRPLALALGRDGRVPYPELAAAAGITAATARRRVSRMLDDGVLTIRCELARYASHRPVSATLWANVPPGELAATAAAIASRPEVRLCAAVAGTQNLVVTVWLAALADLQRLEIGLSARFPGLSIAERAIVLRHHKLMGRVLDEAGRAVRAVDMDIWRPPAARPPIVARP
jgi:DNA-binding Lrp family transcriptional regulator